MCAQLGLIYGVKERQPEECSYLKWLFMYLLLLSERRGPYASGVAWLKRDGSHNIFKRPMRAVEFVKEKQFVEVLSQVDDDTTWLAGHTRWPTRGTNTQENAHPIRAGACLGTVNGTILNADKLFKSLDLPRFAEVDSELVCRMADDTLRDGRIDVAALTDHLAMCKGSISAVMASKLDPKRIAVIKGNKPLELRYHPEHRVMVYASDAACLDVAVPPDLGWEHVKTKPMSIITFHRDDLTGFDSEPFRLAGTNSRTGCRRFTGREAQKTDEEHDQ